MTKRESIIALWDGGLRDKREIARLASSTRSSTAVVLSTAGRLAGRMVNGPEAQIWPKIETLWADGERDLSKIAAAAGSASAAAVRAALQKRGYSTAAHRVPVSGFVCKVPSLMADHAKERGVSPALLAQRILDVVATEGLYQAVLDDGELGDRL